MGVLIADKGYDGDAFRADILGRGAIPVIPNKSNRTALHRFNKRAYKGRNVIERCFCRLKDFRRIATRYDKLARNFLAAVQLAALVAYWITQSWTLVAPPIVAVVIVTPVAIAVPIVELADFPVFTEFLATPVVPADASAPAKSDPIGVAAPVPAWAVPTVVGPAVIAGR